MYKKPLTKSDIAEETRNRRLTLLNTIKAIYNNTIVLSGEKLKAFPLKMEMR
jgi:hypothetical protein